MRFRRLALAVSLSILALPILRAATPQMPVSDIRPGMVGIGRTVFQGTKVEEFRANIVGVIENVIGTQRNLILAKLEGGPLAQTGVIAGMSGSPVYIDGKLIGAVSYALGSFPKEPIAGITPIAEMVDATGAAAVRPPGARVQVDLPITADSLEASFRKALNWNRPFADRPGDTQLLGVSNIAGMGSEIGTLMRPIATPLTMSGIDASATSGLLASFRNAGFVPMAAGAQQAAAAAPAPSTALGPGDAVGVTFVSGDVELGATGTVTHVDENRLYAFGHPMYNLGPIEFPMTRAFVYIVLPSLFSSGKLSSTGEVVGTFTQDRATAIAGRLGAGPSLMPITMTLEQERGGSRTFHFNAVKDQMFGPLMTYTALVNTLTSYEKQFGITSYSVQGQLKVKGHEPIGYDNMFAVDNAASAASAYVIAPVTALMNSDYEKVDLESMQLTVKSAELPRTAAIERVWLDDPRPRPGRTVPLKVLLRSYRGDDIIQTIPITIPANARGNLALTVSDGTRLNATEQREARLPQPRSVPQLVRQLNRARRNNTIYVKLLSSDNGAVVSGETLPSLPPSVLAVIESDRSSGTVNALQTATLGEWQLRTEQAVSGVRSLTIQVSAN